MLLKRVFLENCSRSCLCTLGWTQTVLIKRVHTEVTFHHDTSCIQLGTLNYNFIFYSGDDIRRALLLPGAVADLRHCRHLANCCRIHHDRH